jgi:shikimate dehydrogenase
VNPAAAGGPGSVGDRAPGAPRRLLVGLIGAGIGGSLAPALQQEEARHHGLALHYQLIDLDHVRGGADALPMLVEAARAMRFDGFNVTYPVKQAVMPLLDALSDEADAIGAANTVVRDGERLIGHNTDGAGWAWGFARALPGADTGCVVLLGAGGAGAACADALMRLGAGALRIVDRDAARAAALAARLNERFPGARAAAATLPEACDEATGLVHATPVGMAGTPGLPLDAGLLRPAMWVSEVVYVPLETPLLDAARRAGCAVMDGGHMNVGQAVRGFERFTGRAADPARMETHFRRLAV